MPNLNSGQVRNATQAGSGASQNRVHPHLGNVISLDALEDAIHAGQLEAASMIVADLKVMVPERERELMKNIHALADAYTTMERLQQDSLFYRSIADRSSAPRYSSVFGSEEEMIAAGKEMLACADRQDKREERLDRKEEILLTREREVTMHEMGVLKWMVMIEKGDILAEMLGHGGCGSWDRVTTANQGVREGLESMLDDMLHLVGRVVRRFELAEQIRAVEASAFRQEETRGQHEEGQATRQTAAASPEMSEEEDWLQDYDSGEEYEDEADGDWIGGRDARN